MNSYKSTYPMKDHLDYPFITTEVRKGCGYHPSSIKRTAVFYYPLENNILLEKWHNDKIYRIIYFYDINAKKTLINNLFGRKNKKHLFKQKI